MKQKSSLVLDKEDGKVVQLFAELGMPKNLAKTLTYISQVDECRSADVEQGANLRQPEVSVAMQELKKKGWIDKRDLKKEGKGRPIYIYKLASDLDNIIGSFEKEKLQEIKAVKRDITELKTLLDNR